jgi:hypothetical protein
VIDWYERPFLAMDEASRHEGVGRLRLRMAMHAPPRAEHYHLNQLSLRILRARTEGAVRNSGSYCRTASDIGMAERTVAPKSEADSSLR